MNESATVTTVSPLTVTFDSSDTAVPALALASYVPTLADRVVVDRLGSACVVLGTTGPPLPPYEPPPTGDIDWTALTNTAFTASPVYAKRAGGWVTLKGTWAPSAGGTLTPVYELLGNLPAGCWPLVDLYTDAMFNGQMSVNARIYPNGDIGIRSYSTTGNTYTTSSYFSLATHAWRVD